MRRKDLVGLGREPPVLLVKWYDLTRWILEKVDSFPKSQRFVFGTPLVDHAIDVLETWSQRRKAARRRPSWPTRTARSKRSANRCEPACPGRTSPMRSSWQFARSAFTFSRIRRGKIGFAPGWRTSSMNVILPFPGNSTEPDAEHERQWRSGFRVKSTSLGAIPVGSAWSLGR